MTTQMTGYSFIITPKYSMEFPSLKHSLKNSPKVIDKKCV